jgi:hypothetical protein
MEKDNQNDHLAKDICIKEGCTIICISARKTKE